MIKIEQNMSIQIIENKKVTCDNCLVSERTEFDDIVNCRLNPEVVTKHVSGFCAQGLWLVNGEVSSFKDAFKFNYINGK